MSDQARPRMVTLVRESLGMTQLDLAEAAGLSQGYISKVESSLLPLTGETDQGRRRPEVPCRPTSR